MVHQVKKWVWQVRNSTRHSSLIDCLCTLGDVYLSGRLGSKHRMAGWKKVVRSAFVLQFELFSPVVLVPRLDASMKRVKG